MASYKFVEKPYPKLSINGKHGNINLQLETSRHALF